MERKNVVGNSLDFYKSLKTEVTNIYQHVGIYSFKPSALKKFILLPPSKNEIDRKLEQLRLLDAGIKIGITYVENVPISVDTKEDLILIENILKNKDEKLIVLRFKELMELTVNKLEKMFFQMQKVYLVQHLKKCLLV